MVCLLAGNSENYQNENKCQNYFNDKTCDSTSVNACQTV